MGPEDALLALERHATSKIRDAGDLMKIQTFGFRGEALPSIASVSRFTLKTREPDAVEGTEVVIDGGKVVRAGKAGCPAGTSIEVRQLFAHVPGRRKFLRTEETEWSHIEQGVRLAALARPEVGWVLRRDGAVFWQDTARGALEDRMALFQFPLNNFRISLSASKNSGPNLKTPLDKPNTRGADPLRSKGLISAKGLFLSHKITVSPAFTILVYLESFALASFMLIWIMLV